MKKENIPQRIQEFFSDTKNFDIDDFDVSLSTKDILRLSKNFVENFDSVGDTKFEDEIWFTLKN